MRRPVLQVTPDTIITAPHLPVRSSLSSWCDTALWHHEQNQGIITNHAPASRAAACWADMLKDNATGFCKLTEGRISAPVFTDGVLTESSSTIFWRRILSCIKYEVLLHRLSAFFQVKHADFSWLYSQLSQFQFSSIVTPHCAGHWWETGHKLQISTHNQDRVSDHSLTQFRVSRPAESTADQKFALSFFFC